MELEGFPLYSRPTNAIGPELPDGPGIIAEFKRRSPSRGDINLQADPVMIAGAYSEAGAVAVSILTDRDFFGGSFRDLSMVREAHPEVVLLRKDFIIDPYQLHEARAYGADMVLLIAAILEREQVRDLAQEAKALQLDVLLEVHEGGELEKYHETIRYVGVNNRDLKSFKVDTARSHALIGEMPQGVIPVSESGISDPSEILRLREAGYRLFLMGEAFMKHEDPGEACRILMNSLKQ